MILDDESDLGGCLILKSITAEDDLRVVGEEGLREMQEGKLSEFDIGYIAIERYPQY